MRGENCRSNDHSHRSINHTVAGGRWRMCPNCGSTNVISHPRSAVLLLLPRSSTAGRASEALAKIAASENRCHYVPKYRVLLGTKHHLERSLYLRTERYSPGYCHSPGQIPRRAVPLFVEKYPPRENDAHQEIIRSGAVSATVVFPSRSKSAGRERARRRSQHSH